MSHSDWTDNWAFHQRGEHQPHQIIRHKAWPRREQLIPSQRCMWLDYVSTRFTLLVCWKPLKIYFSLSDTMVWRILTPSLLSSPSKLCLHLHCWETWLLENISQTFQSGSNAYKDFRKTATDVDVVWRSFRARKWLITLSDFLLTEDTGTYGWKFCTDQHVPFLKRIRPGWWSNLLRSDTRHAANRVLLWHLL